jgi:catalase
MVLLFSDKMLQGRLLSTPMRIVIASVLTNEQIPLNRCPYAVNNFERDGHMRVDENGSSDPNYFQIVSAMLKPD